MKKQFQTILNHDPESGSFGDCLAACMATITGIPLSRFPKQSDADWDNHYNNLRHFLNLNGWCIAWFENLADVHFANAPIIVSGKSPRGDYDHATIWQRGVLAHDPFPDGGGFEGPPKLFELILPYADLGETEKESGK